jgi:hypothetical protein
MLLREWRDEDLSTLRRAAVRAARLTGGQPELEKP